MQAALAIVAALFLAMLGALELGRYLATRKREQDLDGARAGLSAMEGAVFALLGLLIAFTFSGASERFATRRALIVTEANAIGTAWLRLDLLPVSVQPTLRAKLREYTDLRMKIHDVLPDQEAFERERHEVDPLQAEIWKLAQTAARTEGDPRLAALALQALNEMFDVGTSRTQAVFAHVPTLILALLFGLSFLASMLAGNAMGSRGRRQWLHVLTFAGVMALTIYVILDLELPRGGLMRIDSADSVLVELRASMG